MRHPSSSWPLAGPARRLGALGAGLLGLGLLTGCPTAAPPAATPAPVPQLGDPIGVMNLPSDTLFTNSLYVSLPSSGVYVPNRRVPALLLSVYYRQDPKTGNLVPGYTKFLVQANGAVTANLLLPDSALATTTTRQECRFRLRVNYEFGRAIGPPYEVSILENPALEATEAGGPRYPARPGQPPPPGGRTLIHGQLTGVLNVATNTLQATATTSGPTRPGPAEAERY